MERHTVRRLAAVALSAGIIAALAPLSGASASPANADARAAILQTAAPEMLEAMQRDFGISRSDAVNRLALEHAASRTAEQLEERLAGSFGGAWLTDDQQLVVAVTDSAAAAQVRAAGARPELVAHSARQLDAAVTGLNRTQAPSHTEVTSWYVDHRTNTVVVQVLPNGQAAAADFIAASGIDADMVRVEVSDERPTTLFNIIGGDPYFMGTGGRCSVGFSVQPRGFVTAGHCGTIGTTTRGWNNAQQGVFQRSNFPGADAAYVAANTSWSTTFWVRVSSTQGFIVSGSNVAAIGATTCRSGSTTGWRCGSITHYNQTVNYPQGTVFGLTRTTACAEPGDSGGSFVAANGQAQGVTSGGSGNCTFGGVTFFQPLNPMLNSYGLSLVTN
jgi:streptogrisin C